MIATWMVYCLLVALLCGLAALSLEHAFLSRRLPTRVLWAVALLLSLAIPAAVAVVPRAAAPSSGRGHHPAVAVAVAVAGAPAPESAWVSGEAEPPSRAEAEPAGATVSFEMLLAWAWLGSSLVVFGGALGGHLLLRRRGSRWPEVAIDGIPVLVSGTVGPAVLGFIRTRIVLPAWAAQAEPGRRRLILEHEREHVAARDPLLLMLGLAALVAAPWNLALWWQMRRLRLAIEIDCDARVLANHPGRAHAYGALLLELGRSASAGLLPIAAFSEPASSLERRIRAMTAPAGSGRRRLVAAMITLTVAVTSAAALPLPPSLYPAGATGAPSADAATSAEGLLPAPRLTAEATASAGDRQVLQAPSGDTLPARFRSEQLQELVEREYPPALREEGVEGYATVGFTIGADGKAREIEPVIADRPEFARAAERLVTQLEFTPAVVGGERVPERVDRFRVHFRLREDPQANPDVAGIDGVLRSALEDLYPELLDGDPVRVPYVFLVVDTLGQRVLSALDWIPPTIAHVPHAIQARFPQLLDREFGPAGRRSVQLEPGARPVEVFYAEVDPPADAMDIERRGPYPLGALRREHTVTDRVMLAAVASRHPEVRERGLPGDQAVWVVGTRRGEIRASGTAPKRRLREEMERHLASDEARFALIGFQEARNGTGYQVWWTLVDR